MHILVSTMIRDLLVAIEGLSMHANHLPIYSLSLPFHRLRICMHVTREHGQAVLVKFGIHASARRDSEL
jgi:hypothetical protein